MKQITRKMLALTTAMLLSGFVHAQTAPFPNKFVTIVVPFPPVGGTDIGARVIAQKLQTRRTQGHHRA